MGLDKEIIASNGNAYIGGDKALETFAQDAQEGKYRDFRSLRILRSMSEQQNRMEQNGGAAGAGSKKHRNPLSVVGDVLGKIWNLPNTLIGLVYGGIGHAVGWMMGTNPYVTFENNTIQFHNNPFTSTAITLGNTILYNPAPQYQAGSMRGGHTLGYEEMQHTYQGQALGPFYLLGHIALGTAAMIKGNDYSINGWHGSVNVLENCPHASTPSSWSC